MWNNFYDKKPELHLNIDDPFDDSEKVTKCSDQILLEIGGYYYIGVYMQSYIEDHDKPFYTIETASYSFFPLNYVFANDSVGNDGVISIEELSDDELKEILWKEIK